MLKLCNRRLSSSRILKCACNDVLSACYGVTPLCFPISVNLVPLDDSFTQMLQADRGKTLALHEFVSSNCNTKAQNKESNSSYTLGISANTRTCLQLGWVLERGSC